MLNFFYTFYRDIYEWLNQSFGTFYGVAVTPFNILQFIFLIGLALWVSRFVFHTLNGWGAKQEINHRFMIYRLAGLSYYIVLIMGILVAASAIGIDFSHLVLFTGAVGIGIGLGLQNIFNHFISGIILLFEDHFRLGDHIELEGGVKGEIMAINFRAVTLKTPEETLIFVPNALLINSRVTINWTPNLSSRCLRISFSVKPPIDQNQMISGLLQEIKNMPLTLKEHVSREPAVYLTQLGENKLTYELWVWIDEKEEPRASQVAQSEYLHMIESLLNKQGTQLG